MRLQPFGAARPEVGARGSYKALRHLDQSKLKTRAICQSCALSISWTLKIAHWTFCIDRPQKGPVKVCSQLRKVLRRGLTSQLPLHQQESEAQRIAGSRCQHFPTSLCLVEASDRGTIRSTRGRPFSPSVISAGLTAAYLMPYALL